MMALFMASWSIGFFALFVAHLYLRLDAVSWPPAGSPPPPRLLTGLATGVVLGSSAAYHWGVRGIASGDHRRLARGLFGATFLSFVFIMVQIAAAMQGLARGLRWDSGVYAGFFWVVGGFHLAHVVVGFAAGLWLAARARRGDFTADRNLPVQLWGYYWHSIGGVWILIYLFIFLPV